MSSDEDSSPQTKLHEILDRHKMIRIKELMDAYEEKIMADIAKYSSILLPYQEEPPKKPRRGRNKKKKTS